MGDINGEGEVSGPGVGSRVSVGCSVRSTGKIRSHLEFGSCSDVRASVSARFRP